MPQWHYSSMGIISTHTLRKEGDEWEPSEVAGILISTHTLRKEGDGLLTIPRFIYR